MIGVTLLIYKHRERKRQEWALRRGHPGDLEGRGSGGGGRNSGGGGSGSQNGSGGDTGGDGGEAAEES